MDIDIYENIDESVDYTENFHKYATGKWIENNPQSEEYPSWDVFTKLSDINNERINKIIKTPGDNIISQKIYTYYNVITDYDRREVEALNPIKSYINKIDEFDNIHDLMKYMLSLNIELLFSTSITLDSKGSNKYEIGVSENGLGLGNKDYYLVENDDNEKVMTAYKTYLYNMLSLICSDTEDVNGLVEKIIKFETELAKYSYSQEELQDPILNYNMKSVEDITESTNFNWRLYLDTLHYTDTTNVIVNNPAYLIYACNVLNDEDVDLDFIKLLYKLSILTLASNKLNDSTFDINFEFSKVFTGATVPLPKEKRAVNHINNIFSDPIGQVYTSMYFDETDKVRVIDMVNNIIDSFDNIINEQSWLSIETKAKAVEKLRSISLKIGYPDKWDDYSDIPVDESLSYFENYMNIRLYFNKKEYEKYYNKEVDKSEWFMSPQSINAYYSPIYNEICFPAGILQYPFYDKNRAKVQNYGAIGSIIAHEITHAFDNHGKEFDKNGVLSSWWSEDETEKFNELTQNTVERYNKMEVLPGLFCNGSLTLGENIADFGGVKASFYAYKNVYGYKGLPGWEKRFFLAYANAWCGVTTEEETRTRVLNNDHAPDECRVNGTLSMFDEWYKAFDISESSSLYVEEDKRAKIW